MRNWFKEADTEEIKIVVAAAISVFGALIFAGFWYFEVHYFPCGDCSTDISAMRR
jgi:hypothetical protein